MVNVIIIEKEDIASFTAAVAYYYNNFTVTECKFQRNLYYALDDGKEPAPQRELKQEYVAFIVYKDLLKEGINQ